MAVSAAAPRPVSASTSLRDGGLWAAVCAYAAVMFALGWLRYSGHRNFVDLGIFAQTTASAFGCFCNSIEGSHWAFHFSPALYLVGSVVSVWHSALALIAVQSVAGALTAPPVYGIVARYADRKAALLAALVVLLYPPLAGVIFNDFHDDGLAPAAVAWLLWAFDARLSLATVLFAILTLAVKEDQALFLIVAGVIGAVAYQRDPVRLRLSISIAAAAVVVFVLFFAVLQPHANANPQWSPARFYAWTSADWRGLPVELFPRAGYLLLAFIPLLFLPFRTWAIAVAIAPLLEILASRMPTTYTMGSHYSGAWIGYVFFAFAAGVAAVARSDLHRAHRLLYWCLALCVVEFAVADPLHPGYFLHRPSARDVRLDAFLRTLPRQADIATQEEAYTHLAATDPRATLLPELPRNGMRACYILTDRDFPDSVRLIESRALLESLVASKAYVAVRRNGGITLLGSRLCSAVNPPARAPR